MNYILDVSKWRCGSVGVNESSDDNIGNRLGKGSTKFLNQQGYMCCLGQFAKQQGVDDAYLRVAFSPVDICTFDTNNKIYDEAFIVNKSEGYRNSELAKTLVGINDDSTTTIDTKINQIKDELHKYNHTLTVINNDGI